MKLKDIPVPRGPGPIEDKLIAYIDLKTQCLKDIKRWFRLVKGKGFTSDAKAQAEAKLITVGICQKIESLEVIDLFQGDDISEFVTALKGFAGQYKSMFNQLPVQLQLTTPDDNGIIIQINQFGGANAETNNPTK